MVKSKVKGAPIVYDKKRHPKAVLPLARDGHTNNEIAERMGVAPDTLQRWRKSYPEFEEAIKEGKLEADQTVVKSIYKRANGYDYEKSETEVAIIGNREIQKKKVTTMHVPGDIVAAIFWITNRQPDKWKRNPGFLNFDKEKGDFQEMMDRLRKTNITSSS